MIPNDIPIPELTPKDIARFWSKVDVRGGEDCWLWIPGRKAYGEIHIWRDGVDRIYKSHRVAWSLINGPIPAGMYVCHDCPGGDNPRCVNPHHLFLGSHEDNQKDKVAKGRHIKGESVHTSVINEHIVREIRSRAAAGERIFEIAKSLNLTDAIVWYAARGKTWKHVT